MLKLEQIHLLDNNDIIVEIMEPIVYTKVGSTLKSDDTIAREKANVFYTIATVVKVYEPLITVTKIDTEENVNIQAVTKEFSRPSRTRVLKVGDNLIVSRTQITPLQFPIEGYDSPKLGVINIYVPFAIVTEDI